MVSTLDSESSDPSSSLGGTYFSDFILNYKNILKLAFTGCIIFELFSNLWKTKLFSEAANIGVPWKMLFLEISQNSQENTSARISFLTKLQTSGFRPATLLEKRLWHRCFPGNFEKFLRTSFLRNTLTDCFCCLAFDIIFFS